MKSKVALIILFFLPVFCGASGTAGSAIAVSQTETSAFDIEITAPTDKEIEFNLAVVTDSAPGGSVFILGKTPYTVSFSDNSLLIIVAAKNDGETIIVRAGKDGKLSVAGESGTVTLGIDFLGRINFASQHGSIK